MRLFKTAWFSRFAEKKRITDDELKTAASEIESGQVEADLGGGVFKKRIARSGAGKSGAYRVIVFFKNGENLFYVYGFAKSGRGNISRKELRELKKTAKDDLALTCDQIQVRLQKGTLLEIV